MKISKHTGKLKGASVSLHALTVWNRLPRERPPTLFAMDQLRLERHTDDLSRKASKGLHGSTVFS